MELIRLIEGELSRAALLASFLITVSGVADILANHVTETCSAGVDACNTALGVLIFAGVMNLGQTWATVLTLFGCMLFRSPEAVRNLISFP